MKKILTHIETTMLFFMCGLMPIMAQQSKLHVEMDTKSASIQPATLLMVNTDDSAAKNYLQTAKVPSCVATPKGQHHRYQFFAYSVENGVTTSIDGLVADIYFNGTDVYVRNLVYSGNDDSYAIGKLTDGDAENGVITFENGVEYAKGQYAYIGTMDDDGWLVRDTVATTFSYKITNGVISAIGPDITYNQAYIMGYNKYNHLAGYVIAPTYNPVDANLDNIVVPSGIAMDDYVVACDPYSSNDVGAKSMIKVGFSGNDVYISGIINGVEESVIKGTLNANDSTVTFPTGIFGIAGNAYVSLYAATLNVSGYSIRVTLKSDEESIIMKFDPDTKTIKCSTPIVVIAGKQTIVSVYNNPEFKKFASDFVVVPEELKFNNYSMRSTDMFYDNSADNTYTYKIMTVSEIVDGNIYFGGVGGNSSFAFKGEVDSNNGKITVVLPQYLGKDEYGEVVYAGVADHKINTNSWPSYDYFVAYETPDTLYFDYDESTGIISYSEGSLCTMAYGGDDVLIGMANPIWTPFPYEKTVMPKGIETKAYSLVSDNNYSYQRMYDIQSSLVKVGRNGNDCYISGWDVDNGKEATLCGTLNGDKLTIKLPQYVSDNENVMLVYAGNFIAQGKCPIIEQSELVFNYDATKDQFKLDGTVNIINLLDNGLYYFNNPVITLYNPQAGARPATPTPDPEDIWDDGRYNYVQRCYTAWTFQDFDTDGNFLCTDSMTYGVFVDGELYTFDPAIYYEEFTEPTTEIPMTLTSSNFDVYRNTRRIAIAVKPEKTIGVQAHFYLNGQKTSSDIATYDIESGQVINGINSTSDEVKSFKSIQYYDLSGTLLVSRPSHGFYITRTTYADGSTISSKHIAK